MCVESVFFCAQVPAAPLAVDILDLDSLSLEQGVNRKFGHGLAAASTDIPRIIGDAKNVSLEALSYIVLSLYSPIGRKFAFRNNFQNTK